LPSFLDVLIWQWLDVAAVVVGDGKAKAMHTCLLVCVPKEKNRAGQLAQPHLVALPALEES
jgi:hypothetical protein